ncbi:hypothetical protein F5B22DRAFT_631372 [Xylaria bambusicola]|uniref:uncharacterized protein n=1 Tax=Xylaria bambusicola TaxID=326684 RepID=UPI002007204F|nr:uncharacterized protein F5B22DRAFT_631372 [Xylaria bambusicola]KAI0502922.1 hypothetical protein F5B22DRAFT_631372 [Xylaria bambusicola]
MSPTPQETQETDEAIYFQDPLALLHYLYDDLRRFSKVVSADIVLHPFYSHSASIYGIAAVQAWEEALVAATDCTLSMDVGSISFDGDYATVDGVLRARKKGLEDLEVGFRGRWRFAEGVPVEHWENVLGGAKGATVKWFEDAGWKCPGVGSGVSGMGDTCTP